MLVLTRRQGQTIVCKTTNGEIHIKLVEINGRQTRIGIMAPRSVPIVRGELEKNYEVGRYIEGEEKPYAVTPEGEEVELSSMASKTKGGAVW